MRSYLSRRDLLIGLTIALFLPELGFAGGYPTDSRATDLSNELGPLLSVGDLQLGDDDYVGVSLPFNFPFCGTNYNMVYVCSNGFLSFVSGSRLGRLPTTVPNYFTLNYN